MPPKTESKNPISKNTERKNAERDAPTRDINGREISTRNDADRKVMELNFTQKTAARPVVAPPGVPADRLAALRAAFAALAHDKEFLADAERSRLEIAPVPGEAIDKVVALIASTPPDIAERYSQALSPAARSR